MLSQGTVWDQCIVQKDDAHASLYTESAAGSCQMAYSEGSTARIGFPRDRKGRPPPCQFLKDLQRLT
ncbi:unnamed protein product [Strongylus vulgaris]|uniref:Uncharacterized protein n=1 Tax=Strongylus vulgaris TaxID=40348 RepID=A0A3P7LUI4_STRVU|nr:unnamed protein product [Strongylus vulgaris]